MKILYLSIISLFWLSASMAQPLQDLKMKGQYQNRPLHLVLSDLETRYHLTFHFDREVVKQHRVTVSFRQSSLGETMKLLLADTPFSYLIGQDRTIALARGTRPSAAEVSPSVRPRRRMCTVSGVVRDQATGERLPFAHVLLAREGRGTETNADGYFTLFHVPSDTHTLLIEYLGYQPTRFRLHPSLDMANLDIPVSEAGVELTTIMVRASAEDQMIRASTGVSQVGFSPAALSTLPSYGEKDIFRSLQLLPGISGTNESSSGLFVRGGTPDQNLILLDGFTVYHVDHLFGFFSAFNAQAVKDIQLHKGGFDAEFGGRLSSVVEMTGKDGNTESFNLGLGASLLSVNGYLEAPFAGGRGSMLLAGRRSFQSGFYTDLFDAFTGSDGNNNIPQGRAGGRFAQFGQQQVRPNSYFYDLNAKVTYRLGRNDVLSLSFYNGEDDLDNSRLTDSNSFGGLGGRFGGGAANFSFTSDNIDLSNWGNVGSSLKWSRKWNEHLYSRATISYSNYFSERDRRNQTTVTREDSSFTRNAGSYEINDLRDFTAKLDHEWKISQNNQIDFGMQFTHNDIAYDYTQNDTLNLIGRDDQGTTTAIYLQDKMTFSDDLIVKFGTRGSYYSPTDNSYLEPRASLTYLLNDRIKVKAATGKYFQFANRIVREDIQQGSRDFWLLADDDRIPIGEAVHFIAGAAYESPSWFLDVEAYHKDLDGLSEYSTRFTPSGRGPDRVLNYEEFFYTGQGMAQGVEFLLQKKVGRLTGWVGYTLGRVKYDFEAFGEEPFFANQDQTHELKIVGNYKWGRWNFSGTFIYATGRPYTAPTGYYEIPLIDGSSENFFEVSSKNGLRLPDYHRLDLSATYQCYLGNSKATLGLSLINLYDRSNIWYKEYEVVEGELFETNISLIDFTPSFFVTWDLK